MQIHQNKTLPLAAPSWTAGATIESVVWKIVLDDPEIWKSAAERAPVEPQDELVPLSVALADQASLRAWQIEGRRS